MRVDNTQLRLSALAMAIDMWRSTGKEIGLDNLMSSAESFFEFISVDNEAPEETPRVPTPPVSTPPLSAIN